MASLAESFEEWNKKLITFGALLKVGVQNSLEGAALVAERAGKVNATRKLNVRSGRLRSSIRAEVRPGFVLALMAGSQKDVKYAALQEWGGTVKPKKSRHLAIPLPAARTAAGVSRYPSPRAVPGLFFLKSKAGNLLLVQRDGDKIRPMYVLKDRVTVPARPYLRPALETARKSLIPELQDMMVQAVLPNG